MSTQDIERKIKLLREMQRIPKRCRNCYRPQRLIIITPSA